MKPWSLYPTETSSRQPHAHPSRPDPSNLQGRRALRWLPSLSPLGVSALGDLSPHPQPHHKRSLLACSGLPLYHHTRTARQGTSSGVDGEAVPVRWGGGSAGGAWGSLLPQSSPSQVPPLGLCFLPPASVAWTFTLPTPPPPPACSGQASPEGRGPSSGRLCPSAAV